MTIAAASPDATAAPGARKIRVIFVCTGNSARSQMAEALLRKEAGDRFDVVSGGVAARPRPPPGGAGGGPLGGCNPRAAWQWGGRRDGQSRD